MGASYSCSPNGSTPYIAIIGAGSAGFAAAIRDAELGANVTLIGHCTIGGTCANVGCVPSKTLIRASETLYAGRAAARFAGILGDACLHDWSALVAQKDELVSFLRERKYEDVLRHYGTISYVEARARFTTEGLEVGGVKVKPHGTIIATVLRRLLRQFQA
jgi:mercuric reductase